MSKSWKRISQANNNQEGIGIAILISKIIGIQNKLFSEILVIL